MSELWHVTTEADEESHGQKSLGYYYGNPVKIAFALADQTQYSIELTEIENTTIKSLEPTWSHVQMSFGLNSKYRKIDKDEQIKVFQDFISNMPVTLEETSLKAVMCLTISNTELLQNPRNKDKIQKALDKLTDEEKKLLGWV